jgi:hypothetical protein
MSSEIFKRLNLRGFQVGKQIRRIERPHLRVAGPQPPLKLQSPRLELPSLRDSITKFEASLTHPSLYYTDQQAN